MHKYEMADNWRGSKTDGKDLEVMAGCKVKMS